MVTSQSKSVCNRVIDRLSVFATNPTQSPYPLSAHWASCRPYVFYCLTSRAADPALALPDPKPTEQITAACETTVACDNSPLVKDLPVAAVVGEMIVHTRSLVVKLNTVGPFAACLL